ncbi:MAG: hypothetical protein WA056_09380 [Gallionella sp.]
MDTSITANLKYRNPAAMNAPYAVLRRPLLAYTGGFVEKWQKTIPKLH